MGVPAVTAKTMVFIGKLFTAVKYAATVAAVASSYENQRKAASQAEDTAEEMAKFNVSGMKYKTAPTQDINTGYQNYLRTLERVAPYYISRYKPKVKQGYMAMVNKREQKAIDEQPSLHKLRKTEGGSDA
jgi:hypothetical protein